MSRINHQIKMAKKQGFSNVDLLRMREIAKKQAEKMENEATERAFLYMLGIPLGVLFHDYWKKSAKKRAPKFIEDVINYYLAVQDGVVSDQEVADLLWELAGVKVEAEWLKGKGINERL